ncbi:MAG: sulfotransferase [Planctomycetes bacterium]|nr:sulfotransferase [Planctomycetota bacterium]
MAQGQQVDVKPIFIVGPPRTGTTLLGRLLAGGDHVLSLSEPFHLNDLLPHWLLRRFYHDLQRKSRLQRMPLPPMQSSEEYFQFLQQMARANDMRFLVMKEVFHELEINPPFANFGLLDGMAARGVPILAIVRHPWDAAASTVRLLRRLFFGIVGNAVRFCWPTIPRWTCSDEIVRWSAKNWSHFVDWTRDRRLFVVRYEDLVRSPADSLSRICEYTGVPFDPRMLEHHRHRAKVFGGIGAPEVLFRRAKPVNARSVGKGRSLTREQRELIREICGDCPADLQYDLNGCR